MLECLIFTKAPILGFFMKKETPTKVFSYLFCEMFIDFSSQ